MSDDIRSNVKVFFSVETPTGLVEYELPKYRIHLTPVDNEKFRELMMLCDKHKKRLVKSDKPLKCGAS